MLNLLISLFLVSSYQLDEKVQKMIETSCITNGAANILNFDVEPFPPVQGQLATITFDVYFTADVPVRQAGIYIDGSHESFSLFKDVKQFYLQGNQESFSFDVQIPQYSDLWNLVLKVEGMNLEETLGCFSFQFFT